MTDKNFMFNLETLTSHSTFALYQFMEMLRNDLSDKLCSPNEHQ